MCSFSVRAAQLAVSVLISTMTSYAGLESYQSQTLCHNNVRSTRVTLVSLCNHPTTQHTPTNTTTTPHRTSPSRSSFSSHFHPPSQKELGIWRRTSAQASGDPQGRDGDQGQGAPNKDRRAHHHATPWTSTVRPEKRKRATSSARRLELIFWEQASAPLHSLSTGAGRTQRPAATNPVAHAPTSEGPETRPANVRQPPPPHFVPPPLLVSQMLIIEDVENPPCFCCLLAVCCLLCACSMSACCLHAPSLVLSWFRSTCVIP